MKKLLLILGLSLGLATSASSTMIYGWGTATCAEMTKLHDDYGEAPIPIKQWIYGYFSGRNEENRTDTGEGKYKAFYAAVLLDCRSSPLDNVIDATYRVYNKLK